MVHLIVAITTAHGHVKKIICKCVAGPLGGNILGEGGSRREGMEGERVDGGPGQL